MLAHPMVPPGHIVVPGSVFQYGQLHASVHQNIMASASANAYRGILARECPGLLQTHAGQPPWNASMVCTGRPPPPETSGASALNPSAPGWGPAMISVPRAGLSGNSVSGWGPAMTSASRAGLSGNSAPRSPSTTRPRDRTPRWKHKAVRNIRSRFPKAYPEQTCPHLGRMSDEAIRALDSDLEQSRNAFLHAREAQRRLSLNTHDVNRTGANESRPDSTTPGVIHTHDVIRLGANESQPDSTITHDVNSNTHDVNRSGAQSRLDSNTHDVNRPEAQSRQNSNTHDVTPDLRKDAPHASERTSQDLPGSPITEAQSRTNLDTKDEGPSTPTATPHPSAAAREDDTFWGNVGALFSPTTELNTLLAQDRRMRENGSPPPATKMTEHDKMEPEVQTRRQTWTCAVGVCGFRHPDFETVAEHEKTCSGKRKPMHVESPAAMEAYRRFIRERLAGGKSVKDQMVREDDLAIDAGLPPPFGGYRSESYYSPGDLRAPELTAVPHCTTSHPPVTPPPQKRDQPLPPSSPVTPLSQESGQPLPPSSDQPMGGGLADHEPAAAGTGGSEFSHVSENAVGEAASSHTSPSTTCTPDLVSHHKMPHPPVTPLSQESGQPLSPSTYNTMGDGLVDHEPAVAEFGGSESSHTVEDEIEEFEPWDVSHPPANPPSQENDQLLPPSSYNTMGGGLAEHEPAVAAIGGRDFRDASKDASKDESEPLTSSQKKRIKKKASKAKRDAEASQRSGVITRSERVLRTSPRRKLTEAETEQRAIEYADIMRQRKSGVHTRFPEDGVDQTSVLPVSVNAVS